MSVALIAGEGGLPPVLWESLSGQGAILCEMRGHRSEVAAGVPRLTFRLETLGTFLETLKAAGVTRICMAGAVRRPEVEAEAIDAATAPLVPRLMGALAKGDDGALREIIAIFEERGFEVLAAHEVAPGLLPAPGMLAGADPGPLGPEMAAARAALAQMARDDLGQALVVLGARVIAREDARGTDAMLADLGSGPEGASDPFFAVADAVGDMLGAAADWLSGEARRGVLVKAPKPGQERRADLPTIGPGTVTGAAKAGLAGIVIEAGGVMVLDGQEVVRRATAAGLFVAVRATLGAP